MPNIALELGKQSAALGVHATYGESRDVNGVTIVPVAISWSGFGAGDDGNGSNGGGGGGFSAPVGAYIRKGDGIHFEPNLVSLVAVGIPFVWAVGHALSRIIRALKK